MRPKVNPAKCLTKIFVWDWWAGNKEIRWKPSQGPFQDMNFLGQIQILPMTVGFNNCVSLISSHLILSLPHRSAPYQTNPARRWWHGIHCNTTSHACTHTHTHTHTHTQKKHVVWLLCHRYGHSVKPKHSYILFTLEEGSKCKARSRKAFEHLTRIFSIEPSVIGWLNSQLMRTNHSIAGTTIVQTTQ